LNHRTRRRRPHLAVLALLFALQPAIAAPARIAIIIDDLGYNMASGSRALELPGPVAFAILPETPHGRILAEQANVSGKEILLHLPLQAQSADGLVDGSEEPGGIILDMNRRQLSRTFSSSLATVPFAIGVNSHRGSLLTRHPGHMRWLMAEISARPPLFFVDSYTTHASIALRFAGESGVPAVRRDVFLDPDQKPGTVEREFYRLKKLALQRGMAVAIGHPYPATLDLLERELPKLADDGVELISISRYVLLKSAAVEYR
jgi:polysaccharide deacetylase 2 family uncharacterized protein YibQ